MKKAYMWNCIRKIAALVTILSLILSWQCVYARRSSMNEGTNELFIIYDNNTLKSGLKSAWGFSCLIILPQYRILFDTGGDPSILMNNMNLMDIHPEDIDSVVLSHGHGDHTGGLGGLLHYHPNVTVYLPKSFPKSFKNEVNHIGARVHEVGGSMMLYPGVYTTGELGNGIKEQSLLLKTKKGLVIITGCAHPGIVDIVLKARSLFKDKVHLLMGGFHLMGSSQKEIRDIIKRLDEVEVERVSPCHCSGDTARKLFREHYGENYIKCGAGLVLEIPDLKE
jgi:7,8-dihydropterin-6-yl-methyl-4-(beta-D-ribofuranosyl)aminobenzene 5'-phosphate synthase